MKFKVLSLKTKIFTFIFSLLFLIIAGMTSVFYFIQLEETAEQIHQLSLQTAQTISLMPETSSFLNNETSKDRLLPVLENIQERTDAETISIAGQNGTLLSTYPAGLPLQESDSRSLIYGGSYTVEKAGTKGTAAIVGKAPVFLAASSHTEVIGTVSVEFSKNAIAQNTASQTGKALSAAAAALVASIAGGLLLTKSILRDTLGYEPYKIAAMYQKTIEEIQLYADDLRAQTHEFMNKLYVLSGLLQLGRTKAALDFIQNEAKTGRLHNHIVFQQIRDDLLQAVLLGKTAKASERKIRFAIEADSQLAGMPAHLDSYALMTVISNVIDNAFDAVKEVKDPFVSFLITDSGHNLIIEVTDNGQGIADQEMTRLFTKGYSTKGKNRGYGLATVKETVDTLGGMIEIVMNRPSGTIFSIYIPIHQKGEEKHDTHRDRGR